MRSASARHLLLLGLIALSACSSSPPADSPRLLAEVPFTLHQNAVIVPAVVNGSQPVHLLLDTGWGPLALVADAVQRLGLSVDAPDAEGLSRTRVASLAIGDAIQRDALIEVFPTETLAPLIGPYDGVLSTAFFSELVLQIDYPAGVVRFFHGSPPADPKAGGASVPMVLVPGIGALPFTDAAAVDGTPARALFDTGGAGAFVAMRRLVERAALQPAPDDGRTGIGMLSGGEMVQQRVQFAQVGRISVGTIDVDAPRVMLAPAQLEGDDWGHDLIVGYGFLRGYVVTFDYPGRRITFERPSG